MASAPEKKYLSDTGGVKEYEIRISSRKDSVRQNEGKADLWEVSIEWIYQ